MKVAVFGGTGFIGQHLVRELIERGDDVVIVSRRAGGGSGLSRVKGTGAGAEAGAGAGAGAVALTVGRGMTGAGAGAVIESVPVLSWQQLESEPELLDGYDAFVNLAGESINQRWTQRAKDRILNSRLKATGAVADLVAKLHNKPSVVLNGSGMSIYGYSDDDTFDEDSPHRLTDFSARTVDAWEREADRITDTRLVKLRVGLVLGTDGGAFPLMSLPYRLFVGGRVGCGKQWHSWIHIKDMTGIILYAIDNPTVSGPINCTAPHPVTNDKFGRTLGKALHRPHWFPVPAFLMRLPLGEMSEVVLQGQRVLPKRILDAGYSFQYPTLDLAFRDFYGSNILR